MDFEENHDNVHIAQLTEEILVSWSKPRVWYGDTVTIRVRTARVLDGSTVELRVFAQGVVAHFNAPPNQQIQDNRLDFDYKIDWPNGVVPANNGLFEVTARIVELGVGVPPVRSAALEVDLIPPLFSA